MPSARAASPDPAVVLLQDGRDVFLLEARARLLERARRSVNNAAPPSSFTCARTSSSAIPRPPCMPVTIESSSRRSSSALPRHGSAESSDSADRDSVLGGTRSDAQISRRKQLASAGMSSRRFRSAGISTRMTDRRRTGPRGRARPARPCRSRGRRRPSAGRRSGIASRLSPSRSLHDRAAAARAAPVRASAPRRCSAGRSCRRAHGAGGSAG